MSAEDRTERIVDEVFKKYEKWANVKYDGEEITLLEHSLQTAALAEQNGSPEEVVLGAFFHDLGHVLEVEQSSKPKEEWKITVGRHNESGYQYLIENHFPEAIASPAFYHVNAKRYLVSKEKKYFEGLSETSKRTLMTQGGPMNEEEASEFEKLPSFGAIIQVRKWDDKAKVVGQITPSMKKYKEMCKRYLSAVLST